MSETLGLALKWDKSVDEAITCLVLIANGGHWQQWQQAHGDTRGIVTERAAMAIKGVQRQNARLLELIQVPIDMIGTTWVESYRASDWVKEAAASVAEMKGEAT